MTLQSMPFTFITITNGRRIGGIMSLYMNNNLEGGLDTTRTGISNTLYGVDAGKNNLSSFHNVLLGYKAGETGTKGNTVAVGFEAGNTTQGDNAVLWGMRQEKAIRQPIASQLTHPVSPITQQMQDFMSTPSDRNPAQLRLHWFIIPRPKKSPTASGVLSTWVRIPWVVSYSTYTEEVKDKNMDSLSPRQK